MEELRKFFFIFLFGNLFVKNLIRSILEIDASKTKFTILTIIEKVGIFTINHFLRIQAMKTILSLDDFITYFTVHQIKAINTVF